jgi:methylated-DNA-[protein]-cysteine S-methyltransferase
MERRKSYRWTQDTPWGAVRISATVDGVHSVELDAGRSHEALAAGAPGPVRAIARAFAAFFAGEAHALEAVPVDLSPVGSGFHRRVLATLRRRVGPGRTITYGQLAELAGYPGAARAVGTAMARNPVPVVVPCHRVLASGGRLGGYGGGLDKKRALLRLEAGGELFTQRATA